MGRPIKKGLNYFPFDIDFFQDEKIVCIAGEFGLKGEITTIKLLCAIYRNGYFIRWSDDVKMKLLHSLPGVSADLLEKIVSSLLKWGFFCRSLFESTAVLTSEGIQQRYFEIVKFRKIDVDNLPYLLIEKPANYASKRVSQGKTPVSQGKTPVSQPQNPQIKGKENKFSILPPTRTLEEEEIERFDSMILEVLGSGHAIWLKQVSAKYQITDMEAAFAKFRQYVIEMAMLGSITDIGDFKRYFIWKAKEFLNDKKNENNNNYSRTRNNGLASKMPPKPGYGLIE